MKFKNPFSYIAPISQEFGKNPQIYNQFGMDGHNGLDFAIPEGTELFAVIDGEVTELGYDATGYGNHIRTKNADGVAIIYAHLRSISVSEGQSLKAGDLLGHTGNTGFSTGPHLHLGLRFYTDAGVKDYNNGYYGYFDPLPYFEDYNPETETVDTFDEVLADPDPVEESEPLNSEDLPASETPSEWAGVGYDFVILNKLSNG
ncbi:M23 family metallopeptidase, partial [Candidatus Peregrinibacteria bacterium]|nr:M23 family metallopeptidase [Candidatus Peregrinibacteria bacterium]